MVSSVAIVSPPFCITCRGVTLLISLAIHLIACWIMSDEYKKAPDGV